jgi:hypothetical protein
MLQPLPGPINPEFPRHDMTRTLRRVKKPVFLLTAVFSIKNGVLF